MLGPQNRGGENRTLTKHQDLRQQSHEPYMQQISGAYTSIEQSTRDSEVQKASGCVHGGYSATRSLEDGEEIGTEGKAGLNWDAEAVAQLPSCSSHPGVNQSTPNPARGRHLQITVMLDSEGKSKWNKAIFLTKKIGWMIKVQAIFLQLGFQLHIEHT